MIYTPVCVPVCTRASKYVCTHVLRLHGSGHIKRIKAALLWDITPSILIPQQSFQYRKKVNISKPEKINK